MDVERVHITEHLHYYTPAY